MDRRAFLATVAGGVLAAPGPAAAQEYKAGKVYRIGYLGVTTASAHARYVEAFRLGLRDLGYVEGKNLAIEYRWAEGKYDRLPDLAAELVRMKVDLIVTHGTPGSLAAKHATTTIPIVMALSGDAVATGLVVSLARPGGNITGSNFFFPELNAKRLEVLTEALPAARRMAALVNPDNPAHPLALKAMESVAKVQRVELQVAEVRGPQDLPGSFSAMVKKRVDAISVLDDPMLIANAPQIADLAAKNRLPTIGFREIADAGGLIAYAVSFPAAWRRAAGFVDKIFKGAKPGELPIEQATQFEFVVNLKTARTLGLTIPPSLLLRADQVIE
jgi:putative tryptophan/tyrosine transport system substrate-binding protein